MKRGKTFRSNRYLLLKHTVMKSDLLTKYLTLLLSVPVMYRGTTRRLQNNKLENT